MAKIKYFFFVLITLFLVSCYRSHFTYYCKERNFTFSVEEHEKEHVLVLGEGDSIFFHTRSGQYMGVEFFLNDTSNIVYLSPGFSCHRIVKKNYIYKRIHKTIMVNKTIPIYLEVQRHYFGFYGGCDQGSYTFAVDYNGKYLGSLEPLEWK